jgi:hypothetical protein
VDVEGLEGIGRLIILAGLVLLAVGLLLMAVGKLPGIGRLPGDFVWRSDNVTVYVPLATSLVISLILTIIINILF